MSAARVVLRLTGVRKTFPGVVALRDVTFDVREGEVHALVGENGAGKSTLMGVAAGAALPDRGTVEIAGQTMSEPSPTAAAALGLAVVYQHTSVLEDLTVVENLVFAMPPGRRPPMSEAEAWARDQLALIGARIDPQERVAGLSVADRTLLEIAKALAFEPRVLVLDEPTESLTAAESEQLFEQIRRVTAKGTAVVYISHRLPEVKQIADRLTVLRDGEVRGTFATDAITEDEILRLIIGRSAERAFSDKLGADEAGERVLEVRGLSGGNFQDIDLDVAAGEIVGLAGIEGNGQREFLRGLAGLHRSQGEVRLHGKRVDVRDPLRAQRRGLVYLPGDRHREGLFLSLSVRENTSILSLGDTARAGVMSAPAERAAVASRIDALAVKTPSQETLISSLSGGNQQKVLFARSLAAAPAVLLADEPTRGVDAGARIELYRVLRDSAREGTAIVVLSSDAVELQGLCDRVVVFSRGQVVRSLHGDEITEESITGAAITATASKEAIGGRPTRATRVRRFAGGDYLPTMILLTLLIVIGVYTAASNDFFLTERNFQGMLFLASAVMLVSMGQLVVLLVGGFDLSVGPLTGLVAVMLSFFATQGQATGWLLLGLVAVLATAVAVGLANGVMVRGFGLTPVLATLVTFIILQGVSLLLRPTPGGSIGTEVATTLKASVGWVPVAFIVVAAIAVVAELLLRRTHWGIGLRAVGSDESRAHRMGAPVTRTHIAAYVVCS
ncbi:MAG TPA: ATP-binding cassette domain-containing protein, partial [Baekduia sp.]|nr:ATP-binding cassette domain-containing protein [Baekduia sp.]